MRSVQRQRSMVLVSDRNLDIDVGLDRNESDLLDDFLGAYKIDDTLVNSHFETIICISTCDELG